MDQKTQDDLLLYWSGEADATQTAAVEALVEADFEARKYFEELGWFDALRDELAELPAMNPSRNFAAEAVAGARVARKVSRFPLSWIAAAAAAIALVALGIKSWPHESNDQVNASVVEEGKLPGRSVNEEPAVRPKLSQRLFSSRRREPAIERISIARDRARKLRTELNHIPTSSL